ncbi:MAG: hypothetical protein AMXMBFR64_23730 [Myxococcales bacterium]
MHVGKQPEVLSEPLNEGHRAGLRAPRTDEPQPPPPQSLPREQRPQENLEHPAEQRAVHCQASAQGPGKGEDPLPIGDLGKEAVHQIRGRSPAAEMKRIAAEYEADIIPAVRPGEEAEDDAGSDEGDEGEGPPHE